MIPAMIHLPLAPATRGRYILPEEALREGVARLVLFHKAQDIGGRILLEGEMAGDAVVGGECARIANHLYVPYLKTQGIPGDHVSVVLFPPRGEAACACDGQGAPCSDGPGVPGPNGPGVPGPDEQAAPGFTAPPADPTAPTDPERAVRAGKQAPHARA